jgi:hypothetical protein
MNGESIRYFCGESHTMVKIISRNRILFCLLILYTALLITSCHRDERHVDVAGIPLELHVKRFEQDLFKMDTSNVDAGLQGLADKYGDFFYLYAFPVTGLGSRDSLLTVSHFRELLSDTNMLNVYQACENQYGKLDDLEAGLTKAFKYYKYYFADKMVPQVLTMISLFAYPVAVDSTHLAIGLDMYLGSDYKYYFTLDPPLPLYIRNRMRKEYILPDAMKGWLMSDYDTDGSQDKFLDKIISQGRLLYALDFLLPDVADTLKTGYTAAQLDWCRKNEPMIWSFFIEQKLLFSTDPNLVSKYTNDGPTTNGFPKDSPGNIGQFIGLQIVRAYMQKNTGTTLHQLMDQKDLQLIFQVSGYKPAKSFFKK